MQTNVLFHTLCRALYFNKFNIEYSYHKASYICFTSWVSLYHPSQVLSLIMLSFIWNSWDMLMTSKCLCMSGINCEYQPPLWSESVFTSSFANFQWVIFQPCFMMYNQPIAIFTPDCPFLYLKVTPYPICKWFSHYVSDKNVHNSASIGKGSQKEHHWFTLITTH